MPWPRLNITPGDRFGLWTVISRLDGGTSRYLCACKCGTKMEVRGSRLYCGRTYSCGCIMTDVRSKNGKKNKTHGLSNTRAYHCWTCMIRRCYLPTDNSYSNYGHRGITVCQRWLDSVETFVADMPPHPGPGYSIERNDVNGNYEPGNCRWATVIEQRRNTRANLNLTYNGETKTAAEWADIVGVIPSTLYSRIGRFGWTTERALLEPAFRGKNATHKG